MAARAWLVVLLAIAAVGGALAQQGPHFVAAGDTTCWTCHASAPIGGAPLLRQFVALSPPGLVQAAPGTAFDYPVRVQNSWSSAFTYVEPRMDLEGAPSLSFVADVPPLYLNLTDAIPVDATRPTEDQGKPTSILVPLGMTYLSIRLEPQDASPYTGPDLALRVQAGNISQVFDDHGRGEAEEYVIPDRAGFAGLGYGNWTVTAELTTIHPTARQVLNFTLPTRQSVPYRLALAAESRGSADRALGLPLRVSLTSGQSLVATFRLIATIPAAPQKATLEALVHTHYTHRQPASDDADVRAVYPAPVQVSSAGGQVTLTTVQAAPVLPPLHNGATMATVAEAVGYATAFLMIASTTAGGMFGKASRRWANGVFGGARRRVAFHNFLSYGLILAAFAHTTLFLVEAAYAWTVGLLWGGLASLTMLGLGFTGALQVPMIRRWSFPTWKWWHWGLAVATFAFTFAHMGLDGAHFARLQDALGWHDPISSALA